MENVSQNTVLGKPPGASKRKRSGSDEPDTKKLVPRATQYRGAQSLEYREFGRRVRIPISGGNEEHDTELLRQLEAGAQYHVTSARATSSVKAIMRKRLEGARTRAYAKGLPIDVTVNWLCDEYDRLKGCCALTGIPFDVGSAAAAEAMKRPFSVSIDRIDSARGYTTDNVRLVCCAVNFAMGAWGEAIFLRIAFAITLKARQQRALRKSRAVVHVNHGAPVTAGAASAPQDEPYSCGYQGYEFGAGCYPDSICINGYLWDADSYDDGLYTQGGEIPCPRCNPTPSVQP